MALALTGDDGAVGSAIATAFEAEGRALVRVSIDDCNTLAGAMQALSGVVARHGSLDGLVHVHLPQVALRARPVADMTDEEWDACCEAPLRSTIALMQAAHPLMRDHGGVIVVVQPTVGLAGAKAFAASAAACEGQRCLVKSVSRAWGRLRIRAHTIAVAPEVFGGEMGEQAPRTSTLSPVSLRGRDVAAQLSSVVATLRFLLSDDAAGLTGTTNAVDSGRWMPL